MAFGGPFHLLVTAVNSAALRLMRAPILDTVLNRRIAALSYVGRRSGEAFTLPVIYRRRDDIVVIDVAMPDRKIWWRNFVAEPGPLELQLRGVRRTAQATAVRDATGQVTVTAVLDQPDEPGRSR